MSSVTVSVAIPPQACKALTRKTADVPQQKAAPQASLQARPNFRSFDADIVFDQRLDRRFWF
jgi:hypothetical protein